MKWCQWPLPMANPRITKAAMAANLAQVARFCRSAPQRSPTTLIQVTTMMAIKSHDVGAGENNAGRGDDHVLLRNDGNDSAQIGS